MAAAKKKPAAAKKPAAKPTTAKKPPATKTSRKVAAEPTEAPKEVVFAPKKSTPVNRPASPPPPPPVAPGARPGAPPAAAPAAASARPGTPSPAAEPTDPSSRVADLWERLERWVAMTGAPPLGLNPPATDKAIKAAEKELALTFPPDVRASLRLHDGQTATSPTFPWLPGCAPLFPLDDLLADFQRQQKLARQHKPKVEPPPLSNGRIKAGIARDGRIPLSPTTFLDLDPGPAGTPGQLITLVSKTDLVLVDTSFTAALERWVNVLERGLWIYDREHDSVHPRALAPTSGHPAGWFSKR